MKKIAIFGCSGLALEVADICHSLDYKEIVLLSNDREEGLVNGLQIKHEREVGSLAELGFLFSIGIGDGVIRRKIAEKFSDLSFPNLVHPSATFGLNQRSAFDKRQGNIIAAGVAFTNNITVGNYGLYNLNATIGHDCIIEDFVSIMPSVSVSGNVHVREECLLGVGAVILQGEVNKKLVVGEGATVGAQTLVIKDVLSNSTVFGVPARVIKK